MAAGLGRITASSAGFNSRNAALPLVRIIQRIVARQGVRSGHEHADADALPSECPY